MELKREVEAARLHLFEKRGPRPDVAAALRQLRVTRKLDEIVDGLDALDPCTRPRQADERDARARMRASQGPQRRQRAQQVAEHQRAKDRDALDRPVDRRRRGGARRRTTG